MNLKYLPIGTVCLTNDSNKKMIIGIDKSGYDYVAVEYPEGYEGEGKLLYFNHEEVTELYSLGYKNEEGRAYYQTTDESKRATVEEEPTFPSVGTFSFTAQEEGTVPTVEVQEEVPDLSKVEETEEHVEEIENQEPVVFEEVVAKEENIPVVEVQEEISNFPTEEKEENREEIENQDAMDFESNSSQEEIVVSTVLEENVNGDTTEVTSSIIMETPVEKEETVYPEQKETYSQIENGTLPLEDSAYSEEMKNFGEKAQEEGVPISDSEEMESLDEAVGNLENVGEVQFQEEVAELNDEIDVTSNAPINDATIAIEPIVDVPSTPEAPLEQPQVEEKKEKKGLFSFWN